MNTCIQSRKHSVFVLDVLPLANISSQKCVMSMGEYSSDREGAKHE